MMNYISYFFIANRTNEGFFFYLQLLITMKKRNRVNEIDAHYIICVQDAVNFPKIYIFEQN